MHPNHYWIFSLSWVLYAAFVIGYMFWSFRKVPRSWLVSSQGRRMQFRQPLALRRVSFLGVSVFATMLPVMFGSDDTLNGRAYQIFIWCVSAFILLFGCYQSGSDDVLLDGEKWSYERIWGWPWRPRRQIGSLDEFVGVCPTPSHRVVLLRKNEEASRDNLRVDWPFIGEETAVAVSISRTIGLPVVDYPRSTAVRV